MKRAATHLFKRQSKNCVFFKTRGPAALILDRRWICHMTCRDVESPCARMEAQAYKMPNWLSFHLPEKFELSLLTCLIL